MDPLGDPLTTRSIQTGWEFIMEPYPSGQFGFIDDPDRQFGNSSVWTLTRTRSDGPEPLLTLLLIHWSLCDQKKFLRASPIVFSWRMCPAGLETCPSCYHRSEILAIGNPLPSVVRKHFDLQIWYVHYVTLSNISSNIISRIDMCIVDNCFILVTTQTINFPYWFIVENFPSVYILLDSIAHSYLFLCKISLYHHGSFLLPTIGTRLDSTLENFIIPLLVVCAPQYRVTTELKVEEFLEISGA